ncbi:hypothetical protein [Polyangium aurulentum]|uniref:hypothetical protein n=1 Tax=Polyangium aurulentum TaxID=2567896 RepID=UPI0010ADE5AF|nr:hypothetical protein [Polyangium aurulentum]UQA55708.1 hypothetical protein E8A73_030790 [Polyangium aurulentum]
MMANASRDPLFWAALAVAEQDVPEVGDMCQRCHVPVGWLGGRVTGAGKPGAPPTRGQALLPDDFQGVSCHVCHRMQAGPDGEVMRGNGQIFVADDDVRRGPYEYTDVGHEPPHAWRKSDLFEKSELCGQCHDVTNPLVRWRDAETGADKGKGFPLERTFSEWAASAFAAPDGQTCQDCHMPPQKNAKACNMKAPVHEEVPKHDFAGGNAWIPLVLAGEHPELGRQDAYEAAHERAMEMLQERSAKLTLSVPDGAQAGTLTRLVARVENLTGHKLPTGYAEGRRMWLSVEVHNGGAPLFRSGVYDPQTAKLEEDDQIKVYEAVHGILGKGPGFHFVQNDMIVKDNRIPPRGLLPTADLAPVGASFEVLPGGELAHWDDTEYEVALPHDLSGDLTVTVELYYQTSSREYIEFLRSENKTDGAGEKMYSLWEKYDKSPPVLMATATVTVPIAACDPVPETCNGADDDCDGSTDEDACTGEGSVGADIGQEASCQGQEGASSDASGVAAVLPLAGAVFCGRRWRRGKTQKRRGLG